MKSKLTPIQDLQKIKNYLDSNTIDFPLLYEEVKESPFPYNVVKINAKDLLDKISAKNK
jgi:hypothetical protein